MAPTVAVSLDVYPARVVLPDGAVITKVKAMIADGELILFVMQDGSPFEYYRRKVASVQGNSPVRGYQVYLIADDGGEQPVVGVTKSGGCGCGDKLKNYNPWPGTRRARAAL